MNIDVENTALVLSPLGWGLRICKSSRAVIKGIRRSSSIGVKREGRVGTGGNIIHVESIVYFNLEVSCDILADKGHIAEVSLLQQVTKCFCGFFGQFSYANESISAGVVIATTKNIKVIG